MDTLPAFYLVIAGNLVWEQDVATTIADAVETCWNVDEPNMKVLKIDPTTGTVADATKEVAEHMIADTLDRGVRWRGNIATFLSTYGDEPDWEALECAPDPNAEHSTLNGAQQGIRTRLYGR